MLQRETNLSHEELRSCYKKFSRQETTFGPVAFLKYLSIQHPIAPSINSENFFSSLDWSHYIDRDLFHALEILKNDHELWILTKGESSFQQLKIQKTGLNHFFSPDRVIVCENSKCEALVPHNFSGDIIFVNDKYHETREVISRYKNFLPIIFSGFSKLTPAKRDDN